MKGFNQTTNTNNYYNSLDNDKFPPLPYTEKKIHKSKQKSLIKESPNQKNSIQEPLKEVSFKEKMLKKINMSDKKNWADSD